MLCKLQSLNLERATRLAWTLPSVAISECEQRRAYELQLQEDNWQLRFNSTWKGYDDSLSDLEVAAMEIEQLENKLEGKLDIPAYGALIFSR